MADLEESEDIVVSRIGIIGRWQLRTVLIMSFCSLVTAWQTLEVGFLFPEVEYRCIRGENMEHPVLEGSEIDWSSASIESSPLKDNSTDSDHCFIFNGQTVEKCAAWVYEAEGSLVQEFDLVCDQDVLRSTASSVYMGGQMFGVLASGVLSDLYGRKTMITVTSFLFVVFGCSAAASPSMIVFIILRFFVSACSIALYTCSFVYCIELVGGIWNVIVGIGLGFPWAVAYMALPAIAYVIPYWSHLQLALSVPALGFFALLFVPGLLPESPKWLYFHSREKEAEEILKKAAEYNGNYASNNISISKPKEIKETEPSDSSVSLQDILKSPHTIVCTLVMFYLWFTNALVYYGLVLNAGSFLPGNIYINNIVAGSLEMVATAAALVVFLYGGRRFVQSGTLILSGVCLLLTLATEDDTAKIVFGQIGKFAITASFLMVYLYAAEIFPTVFRNIGMGTSSLFARIGSVLAPFAGRELKALGPSAPACLFGLVSLVAGVLTLVLPETKETKLPDTLKEGEEALRSKPGAFRRCLPTNP